MGIAADIFDSDFKETPGWLGEEVYCRHVFDHYTNKEGKGFDAVQGGKTWKEIVQVLKAATHTMKERIRQGLAQPGDEMLVVVVMGNGVLQHIGDKYVTCKKLMEKEKAAMELMKS